MEAQKNTKALRVWADFNGVFGGILCLSHRDTALDENGKEVHLVAGTYLTAFMEDTDEQGNQDNLIASGRVDPVPEWLSKHGSKWVLVIDEKDINHESNLRTGRPT